MRDRAPGLGLRPGLIAAAAVLLLSTISGLHAQSDPAEVRALWILRATLSSPTSIATMVDAARDGGFNTLLVQVPAPGEASSSGPALGLQSSFDPLSEVIARAHETGLRVHASVDITRVSSAVELPPSRDPVIYRHPEWLMVPRALAPDLVKVDSKSPEFLGRLTRYARSQPAGADAVYLSPASPGAIEYTAGAVRELLSRYPLDGIHFDDARYPGSDFDYGRDALSAFRRSVVDGLSSADQTKYDRQLAVEPLIYTEAFPDHWRAFRAGQLTTLVARLRDTVSAVRPGVVVSATVLPDPEQALASRFQDWRAWLGRGLIDVVAPMLSTVVPSAFAADVASVRGAAGGHPTWAAIGATGLSETEIVASVKAARRLGAGGVILFSYDGLTGPSRGTEYLAQVGRAAFTQ
jgi:uncharacterized lipoprotein YddW (UPF0748 family)